MIPIAKVHCTQVSSLIFPGALPSPAGSLGQLRFVLRKLLVESVDIRTYDVCIPSRHELSVSHGLLSALHAIPHSLSLSPVIFLPLPPSAASPTSPDKKAKRHEVKSDPTPFGLRGRVAQPSGYSLPSVYPSG